MPRQLIEQSEVPPITKRQLTHPLSWETMAGIADSNLITSLIEEFPLRSLGCPVGPGKSDYLEPLATLFDGLTFLWSTEEQHRWTKSDLAYAYLTPMTLELLPQHGPFYQRLLTHRLQRLISGSNLIMLRDDPLYSKTVHNLRLPEDDFVSAELVGDWLHPVQPLIQRERQRSDWSDTITQIAQDNLNILIWQAIYGDIVRQRHHIDPNNVSWPESQFNPQLCADLAAASMRWGNYFVGFHYNRSEFNQPVLLIWADSAL